MTPRGVTQQKSPFLELALVLMRLNHVASVLNTNHGFI